MCNRHYSALRVRNHSFSLLSWGAALLAALLFSLVLGAVPIILANSGEGVMELTVEQARDLAYANNLELQGSYLALEQAELVLQALADSMNDLEERLSGLHKYKEGLAARQAEIQEEIDKLESEGDPEGLLPGLYRELLQVQAAIQVADIAIAGLNMAILELDSQYRAAAQEVAEGRELVALQKEMLAFQVEALFAGCLIVLEQQPLHQSALAQQEMVVAAEQNKQKEGYSTPLEVEMAALGKRELEAAGDQLKTKYIELIDYLCVTCGLTPGISLYLVPFSPIQPLPLGLNDALEQALSSGWLIQQRRQRVRDLEAERDRVAETFGADSIRYRMADLAVQGARLQLLQADGETRAAVRRTYYTAIEKEGGIARAEADLMLGRMQKQALEAQYKVGYGTPAEAAQAPLALWKKEAGLFAARYLYHIAYREFELARRGYFITKEPEL